MSQYLKSFLGSARSKRKTFRSNRKKKQDEVSKSLDFIDDEKFMSKQILSYSLNLVDAKLNEEEEYLNIESDLIL